MIGSFNDNSQVGQVASFEVLGQDGDLDANRRVRPSAVPSQGIQVTAIEQSILEHLGQPPKTLGPNQRNVLVGQTSLAAGVFFLRFNAVRGNIIEFRQQADPIARLLEFLKACTIVPSGVAVAAVVRIEQEVSEEKRPLALDVLENLQLARLVIEALEYLRRTV